MANDDWMHDREAGQSAQLPNERQQAMTRMGTDPGEAAKKAAELRERDAARARNWVTNPAKAEAEFMKRRESDPAEVRWKKEHDESRKRADAEYMKRYEENRAKSESVKNKQASGQRLGGGKNVGSQREAATQRQPSAQKSSRKSGDTANTDGESSPPQALGGVFFWMVGGLAMMQDFVVDPATDGLIALGFGGSALTAGVGLVVGIPIAVLAWTVKIGFLITVWLIMWVYYYLHGGVHATVKMKRFVIWGISFFTSWVPVLALLPATTFAFFMVAVMENLVRKDNLVGFVARTAVDRRPSHFKKIQ